MSESKYWAAVGDIVSASQDDGTPKNEVADSVVGLVHQAHAAGEPWATETLMRWDRAGAARDYTEVFKNLNSTTYIRRDGRRVRKTTGYSRPVRDAESGELIGQQLQTWWGMTRPELADLLTDLSAQKDRLGLSVEGVRQVVEAMDRHPDCTTAREAWEADGRSVTEIDLGQAI